MKTTRQIVEELIAAYVESIELSDKLESLGVRFQGAYKIDRLWDWALDLIGFPPDTTVNDDKSFNPDGYCRDWLSDQNLLGEVAKGNVHSKVSDYVDWLYLQFEECKKDDRFPVE